MSGLSQNDQQIAEGLTKIANAALDGIGVIAASVGGEITTLVTGGDDEKKPDSLVLVCIGKRGCPVLVQLINELLASDKLKQAMLAAGANAVDVGMVPLDATGKPQWDKPSTPKKTIDDVKKGANGDPARN